VDAQTGLVLLGRLRGADLRLFEVLRATLTAAQATIDDLTAQRAVLHNALGAREADAAARGLERDALAAERKRLSDALIEGEKARADLTTLVAERDGELHAAQQALVQVERDLRALTVGGSAAAAQTEDVARLSAERDEARAALEEARAAGATALKQLHDDADAREARLRKDHEKTRDELAQLTESLLQLEATFTREQAKHDALRAADADEKVRLEGLVQQTRKALQESHESLAALTAEHAAALEAFHAQREQELLQAVQAAQEAQAAQDAEKRAALEAALDAAHEAAHEVSQSSSRELQELKASLVHRASVADDEISSLRTALVAATSDAQEAKARATREAEQVQAQLADMQRELFEADELLDNASADMARLQGEVTGLRRAVDEAQRLRVQEVEAASARLDERRVESLRLEELLAERERVVEELRHLVQEKTEALSAAEEATLEARAETAAERKALEESLDEVTKDLHEARMGLSRLDSERTAQEAAAALARNEAAERQRQLDDLRQVLVQQETRASLALAQLTEAQEALGLERARGDLSRLQLDEVRNEWARTKERLAHAHHALQAQLTAMSAQLADEQRSRATLEDQGAELFAELELLRANLRDRERMWSSMQSERALSEAELVACRAAAAEANTRMESLRVELQGVREALQMARDDVRDAEMRLEHQFANATVPPGFVEEVAEARQFVARAAAAQEAAENQRDAAIADLEAARVSARLESRRRADLEGELLRVRAERDALRQAGEASGAGGNASDIKERLQMLERETLAKDQKLAEQAERLERLTERIIRSEDIGRGR
jgi:colicin import membrane protein